MTRNSDIRALILKKPPTYIDLFAGCGGLSLGLKNAGWKGVFAIESSSDAFKTLNHNLIQQNHFRWTKWLPKTTHDISQFVQQYESNLKGLRGRVDMVAGAPPCQGYSIAGRRQEFYERNDLIEDYIRVVELVNPKIVLFENVQGFSFPFEKHSSKSVSSKEYLINNLTQLGYNIEYDIVEMSNYGLPQKRIRYILIATKKNIFFNNPFFKLLKQNVKPFLRGKNLPFKPNLSNAIGDLLKNNGTKNSRLMCP